MFIDAGVGEAGVFVAFEFVDGVVHECAVEYSEADEEFKIFD